VVQKLDRRNFAEIAEFDFGFCYINTRNFAGIAGDVSSASPVSGI